MDSILPDTRSTFMISSQGASVKAYFGIENLGIIKWKERPFSFEESLVSLYFGFDRGHLKI